MHPLILDNLEAIRALCRKFRVARLDVFGSVTTDAFDPDSSGVDFIVESPADYASGPVLSQYFELKNGLGERTIVQLEDGPDAILYVQEDTVGLRYEMFDKDRRVSTHGP